VVTRLCAAASSVEHVHVPNHRGALVAAAC
jgi:hypothetical protein